MSFATKLALRGRRFCREDTFFNLVYRRDLEGGGLGTEVSELCRQNGISEQSYYRWKKLDSNMESSEARELRQLRVENTKLKRLWADLSLDKAMLQDVLQKNLKPAPKRHVVKYLMDRYSVGAKRACQRVRLCRSA